MLKQLEFHNYRCFSSHVLPLERETIIVGRNNAGKSTVIEGFRLIGIVTERYRNVTFHDVPPWLDIPLSNRGLRVNLSGLNLSWENLFHRYQNPPSRITATFDNGSSIELHLGENGAMHAVLNDSSQSVIRTKVQARTLQLPILSVLPQVMPLSKEERALAPDYVRANLSSYLSPLHFRNQLNLFYDQYFDAFKAMVEDSWPSLQIIELQCDSADGDRLGLLVRDGDFVAEVSWMGHGVQMWLQTMWFLTRTRQTAIIVLDEPDVYMHPDLQRRLLRFLRGRYPQCIIATHSTEILAETDPSSVLILDRTRQKSKFTTALPAVQRVLDHIGSSQNMQLTRLWTSKRLLLLEGKDVKFLRHFKDLLFPESEYPLDAIPNMPIGGWSGWPYAVGSAMLLRNAGGEEILTYCILDSDYHTEEEKGRRRVEAADRGVQLHVWRKKEIENYLIVPGAIMRVIHARSRRGTREPSLADINKAIEDIAESMKVATTDALAQEILNQDRSRSLASANKQARSIVEKAWISRGGRTSIVSGKDLLSKLSQLCQENFNVSFGTTAIVCEIARDEIDSEIVQILTAIENLSLFPDLSA
ncbi:MAG: AAA family ATPase [Desulfomonilaceae bacterium]|nr:AAA family ATPase [Desulfomonilaceae bacterium]